MQLIMQIPILGIFNVLVFSLENGCYMAEIQTTTNKTTFRSGW